MGFKVNKKNLVNFLKARKDLIVDILILLLLGFLSITWFKGNYLINSGDFGMPFDWVKYLKSMFSVWYENVSTGMPDYRNIAGLIPYALLGGSLQFSGFSLVFIEKLFFYFWFAGSGLSMYFLAWVLRMKRLGRMTSALFYMFNPFSLIIIWHISHALIQMPYAFAPLYLGLFIYGLNRRKGFSYIIFAVFLWLITTTAAYAWPAAVVIHWIPIFFYFLISLIFDRQNRIFTLKFSLKFLFVWLVFNFYWLFPFIKSITESLASAHSPVLLSDIGTLKLTSVKILDGIRMMGYWALHEGYKGEPYYTYEAFYRLPIINIIGWFIPIFVLLGFFHKDIKKKKIFLFYLLIILFGLLGMSGVFFPLGIGKVLLWLYQTFPSLALLIRFAFLFFGIPTYLIFTILLAYGVVFLKDWGLRRIGRLIFLPLIVLFILLFVVLVWPFWNGEVVRSDSKIWPGERVKVPAYWWEARKWLEGQKDFFRILPLPMSKTYNVAFDWEQGFSGGDPTRWLAPQPFLLAIAGETKITELIGSLVEKEADFKDLNKLLSLLNVKYLLYREDIRWDFLRGHGWWFKQNPEKINLFLNQQKDLELVKEIGKFKFYEVPSEYSLPHIYASPEIALINGEVEGLADITRFLNPQKKETLFFTNQNENNNFSDIKDLADQSFVWQRPLFLTTGETESMSLEEATLSLPYVRFYPNSSFYPLIKIKESLTKFLISLPKKIELELTFSGKRLKEVFALIEKQNVPLVLSDKYKAKEENMGLIIKTMNSAINEWKMVDKQLNKIKNRKEKEILIDKIEDQALFQETFIRILERDLTADQQHPLYQTVIELEKILESKRKKFIEPKDLALVIKEKFNTQKAIYKIEIARDDQYEIYLRNDNLSKYFDLAKGTINFAIDNGSQQEKTIESIGNNSLFLGSFNLKNGSHEIEISLPQSINLISDPSFEQGLWSDAKPIPSNLGYEIKAEQFTDASQGKFSLKLSSVRNNAVVFTPINDFEYGDIYKVSFNVKYVEGVQPVFGVWENDTKSNIPDFDFQKINKWGTAGPQTTLSIFKELPTDKSWRRYEFILKPQDSTQSLGLAFFSLQPKIGKTINLYDDVRVEKIFSNPIFIKGSLLERNIKIPSLNFKKINPNKYEIKVKNATDPYFLVFSESYHPGWKASVGGEHLTLNGFANAWYIEKTGDYQIILDFRPQRIYYISISVSVFALFASMIYLLIKKKNES